MHPTAAIRMFQPTKKMWSPVPKEEHSAHTISQRLRQWRKIPPELVPLGVVVSVAVGFGCYSLGKKFVVDQQMRLSRQNRNE
ncbi:hypothetical protein DSL72_002692 [Monilinia vaccinii-corymbosi]|uniref:Uncharacterized protein n=1 Tax=Monilinia vaccinii-corymbosi TaxID=61207 RepID=A0A8A3PD70_9HELO|nr:hypothetical protein DSL72_002692 [Monilinia vaccinii-corymbosi]